jgi:hypothetical protein
MPSFSVRWSGNPSRASAGYKRKPEGYHGPVKIDITIDEAEAIRIALERYNAYLYSQKRETEIYRQLEKLFAKLAASERR